MYSVAAVAVTLVAIMVYIISLPFIIPMYTTVKYTGTLVDQALVTEAIRKQKFKDHQQSKRSAYEVEYFKTMNEDEGDLGSLLSIGSIFHAQSRAQIWEFLRKHLLGDEDQVTAETGVMDSLALIYIFMLSMRLSPRDIIGPDVTLPDSPELFTSFLSDFISSCFDSHGIGIYDCRQRRASSLPCFAS